MRIPVNYRHLESDARPFEIIEDGFRHLDRAIAAGGEHGIYTLIDLHALPGSQNQHWHSDNPTHRALFWEHRHFQDRVVGIWEAIADRYKGNPWVAGYNLMNEPADESRAVVGPFYERLSTAIREIDPEHILFFDGNTYSTEFGFFGEPLENAVYTLHDYVPAGLGRADEYPGRSPRRRSSSSARSTRAARARRSTSASSPRSTRATRRSTRNAGGSSATSSRSTSATAPASPRGCTRTSAARGWPPSRPDSPYGELVADFVAKKRRLGVDQWGSTGRENPEVTQPIQDLVEREAPDFDPYPWGRFDFVRTLVLNITLAQPLAGEYAELFRGLGEDELTALADSWAFENCVVRESLRDQLSAA